MEIRKKHKNQEQSKQVEKVLRRGPDNCQNIPMKYEKTTRKNNKNQKQINRQREQYIEGQTIVKILLKYEKKKNYEEKE